MISVIIPTLNAAEILPRSLACLAEANMRGMIAEVILADGGSTDDTKMIAEEVGAKVIDAERGRGTQLKAGAAAARGEWLMFLHADTALIPGWPRAVTWHIEGGQIFTAGVFKLGFDASGLRPSLVARGANLRARLFRLPYGDQGLLISRHHYDEIGGYAPIPLFEDVNIVRRIVRHGGRRAIQILPAVAMTKADRYENDGYFSRVKTNMSCLRAYFAGKDPAKIAERYYGDQK